MTGHKSRAFTLIESLICITIISLSIIAATNIISVYQKTVYERDVNIQALAENISILEEIKAKAKELSDIFPYTQNNEIKIYAIGLGEIELSGDGSFTVINPENYAFSDSLIPASPHILKIEVGKSQKISAVMLI